MKPSKSRRLPYAIVELEQVRYAILRESALLALCRRAGVRTAEPACGPARPEEAPETALDQQALARRLVFRRKRAGLTQAQLARRAGVRVETLNRLERGRTTPDFATIRKLATAMHKAETALRPNLP